MTTKKIAIIQSNYIPWKGYFHIIHSVDALILLDDVQYTRRDWRNRNKIKTKDGLKWLTIPVQTKGNYHQRINETQTQGGEWTKKHWHMLEDAYRSAPFFRHHSDHIYYLYQKASEESYLSHINMIFLRALCDLFQITTPISFSTDYYSTEVLDNFDATERLVALCKKAGADCYLSGPSAKNYLDCKKFENEGIAVDFMQYPDYTEYPQGYGSYEHYVSILDVLFHVSNDITFITEGS